MSSVPDWVLISLIAALVALLLLTLFGLAVYSGLLTEVEVRAGPPPIRGGVVVAYKFRVGPYDESGNLYTESVSLAPKLVSVGVYYDNPMKVPVEFCRYIVGSILSEGDEKPLPDHVRIFPQTRVQVLRPAGGEPRGDGHLPVHHALLHTARHHAGAPCAGALRQGEEAVCSPVRGDLQGRQNHLHVSSVPTRRLLCTGNEGASEEGERGAATTRDYRCRAGPPVAGGSAESGVGFGESGEGE
ncbi:unnamed protein product [Staurois parvus]|uniref:Uncharacterized protein n=1 Tax=Staurois parvus TaxID=386267 RepID=A0ABN9G720_9NEOB|nr:unnamed protein product [Staurois parvus]